MIARSIPTSPPQAADFSDVADLQRRLLAESEALSAMAGDVGKAKHVLSYDGDLRKRALARAMQPALAGGDSVSKADSEARSSAGYSQELAVLAKQHQAAEETIAEWDAKRCAWETCRSLLSLSKETMRQL